MDDFIQEAIKLESEGLIAKCLDVMYGEMIPLLVNKEWDYINSLAENISSNIEAGSASKHVIISMLVLTYRIQHKIPARNKLYENFKNHLININHEDIDGILYGLHPKQYENPNL